MTAMNAALKELYDGQTVQFLGYKDNPALAMLPKAQGGGKYKPFPVISSPSAGVSAAFATAQANIAASNQLEFLVTQITDYSVAQIDRRTMLASANDADAFIAGAKLTIDMAIKRAANRVDTMVFRSGTGSIGTLTLGSVITAGVVTLLNPGDAVNFELNQVVVASATDGSVLIGSPGYVVAVDRVGGVITFAATLGGAAATPAGWSTAVGVLYTQGDALNAGTTNLQSTGLGGWLPVTNPSGADNFFGVNRSVDRVRLAGTSWNGTNQSIEEALIDAAIVCAREGGSPDYVFLNPFSFSNLQKSIGSRVMYTELKMGELFFRGLELNNGVGGTMKVFAERNCPTKLGYILTLDSWEIYSAGDVPHLQQDFGAEGGFLRVGSADAGEVRVSSYYNVGGYAPGRNAVVSLSA